MRNDGERVRRLSGKSASGLCVLLLAALLGLISPSAIAQEMSVEPDVAGSEVEMSLPLSPSTACEGDADCDDGDYCTLDRCINDVCTYEFVEQCPESYLVTDLGTTGYRNLAWSINQLGEAVGWSDFSGGSTKGFFSSCGAIEYVGFTPGTSRSDLIGINNLGQAVGKVGTTHEPQRAILWSQQEGLQALGTLGGSRSWAVSINDLGQVVGSSKTTGDAATVPFVWEAGEMEALPTLGGDHATASWINNAGQIVGDSTTEPGVLSYHACLWEDNTVVQLPPLNGLIHTANYIHDNGDIAGYVRLPEGPSGSITRAAIWRNEKVYRLLGTLADGTPEEPSALSTATGVNAAGIIVGMSVPPEGGSVPYVQVGDEMLRLDDLLPGSWQGLYVGAGAINDAGQIAIQAIESGQDFSRALLLTPILRPLPGDFDNNGARDLDDYAAAAACLAGPDVMPPSGTCATFDFDRDADIDFRDVARFLRMFTGEVAVREVPGQTCQDGLDNDGDGVSDCDDGDCAADPMCSPCR